MVKNTKTAIFLRKQIQNTTFVGSDKKEKISTGTISKYEQSN